MAFISDNIQNLGVRCVSSSKLPQCDESGGGSLDATLDRLTCAPKDVLQVTPGGTTNANVDIAIAPRGTGALSLDVPDNSVLGGNCRGDNAVDGQMVRTLATQVASGTQSVLGGGSGNTASGTNSVVDGGLTNTASGTTSVVGGGTGNTADTTAATVSGGATNSATGVNSTVGGGSGNTASSTGSTVAGGTTNVSSGSNSFVGGGTGNQAVGPGSGVVSGGTVALGNLALGQDSVIGGGTTQYVHTSSGTGGGFKGSILGGERNVVGATLSTLVGPALSFTGPATNCGVTTGTQNLVTGDTVDSTNLLNCHIVTGSRNCIGLNGTSFAAAGPQPDPTVNTGSADNSCIACGANNSILNDDTGNPFSGNTAETAFIGGGTLNICGGKSSGILCGTQNRINSQDTTFNASGNCAIVCGQGNVIQAQTLASRGASAILCGSDNGVAADVQSSSVISGGSISIDQDETALTDRLRILGGVQDAVSFMATGAAGAFAFPSPLDTHFLNITVTGVTTLILPAVPVVGQHYVVFGVDVGGTATSIALTSAAGNIIQHDGSTTAGTTPLVVFGATIPVTIEVIFDGSNWLQLR